METAKKGFTLIELIVVIAIISVLAAILVPSMLGYVKKSKVSSANSAASSIQKAINTALIELDEEFEDTADITYVVRVNNNPATALCGANNYSHDAALWKKIQHYMDKARKSSFHASCDGGAVKAVAVALDKKYTGTYPSGVVTVDNYTLYSGIGKLSYAVVAAESKLTT